VGKAKGGKGGRPRRRNSKRRRWAQKDTKKDCPPHHGVRAEKTPGVHGVWCTKCHTWLK